MRKISRREFIKNAAIAGTVATAFPKAILIQNGRAASKETSMPLLLNPPYLSRPTQSSITINLVAAERDIICYLKFRQAATSPNEPWQQTDMFSIKTITPIDIVLRNLMPGTLYQYEGHARHEDSDTFQVVWDNKFMTQRQQSSGFSFAVISDSHIAPRFGDRFEILSEISSSILTKRPDFLLMLGDNIQTFTSHGGPMIEEKFGPMLYSALRHGLSDLPSSVPVFTVIGNWEGENGWHPARERNWAQQARRAWLPNPDAGTYPEGGSENEDYYGFTWGNVLFLVLNVTGYTPADHRLQSFVGKADDWTLGEKQKAWLYRQLSNSNARWKLLFIHHTVGGNAGDDVNSRYGRGGGQAARTGEQALIHEWMLQFGVQALFYGHDHVFTDNQVDGIHYICVGSAGAPWKFPESVTGYKDYWTSSGFTWVDIEQNKLKISFISPHDVNDEEKVLASFSITKI